MTEMSLYPPFSTEITPYHGSNLGLHLLNTSGVTAGIIAKVKQLEKFSIIGVLAKDIGSLGLKRQLKRAALASSDRAVHTAF